MFKKERGITLVALVVTIIVLLILAGVAISLTISDNGIFTRARRAADTWVNAEQNETKTMDEFNTAFDSLYKEYFPGE